MQAKISVAARSPLTKIPDDGMQYRDNNNILMSPPTLFTSRAGCRGLQPPPDAPSYPAPSFRISFLCEKTEYL
jgi:hypothetical protein